MALKFTPNSAPVYAQMSADLAVSDFAAHGVSDIPTRYYYRVPYNHFQLDMTFGKF